MQYLLCKQNYYINIFILFNLFIYIWYIISQIFLIFLILDFLNLLNEYFLLIDLFNDRKLIFF